MNSLTIAFLALSSCSFTLGCSYSNTYGADLVDSPYIGSGLGSSGCGIDYPILSEGCDTPYSDVQAVPSCGYDVPQYNQQPGCLQSGRSYLEGSIDCGPCPQPTPIKYLSPVVLTPKTEPIRVLPAPPAPAPIVIANKCTCTKVVQKPQLYQRLIVAQKNQRFLKKSYVPRTEKVEYCAKPRC